MRSSQERTINIPVDNRFIYIELQKTARSINVPEERRKVYIESQTTAGERTVLIME